MKALFINSVCGIRSTGRICTDLAKELEQQGYECKIAYGREEFVPVEFQKYAVRIGNNMDVRLHALEARLLDNSGFGSKRATKAFLEWADDYDPDLLWLHNIHGYYINVEMLFDWIKSRPNMQVKWTLHDCWAFTGHCTYFTYAKCDKWKTGCHNCPEKKSYPKSNLFDASKTNYMKKKKLFTEVNNLEIITPSNWLANLVKESFLKEYTISLRYNTVDTDIFKPTPSDFKDRYGIKDKKMILGVASVWDRRKGLDDFVELSKMLDNRYQIVLVGLTNKQISKMPNNIICIERTNSKQELAEIYSVADVFVNPTYEDNYPTTNLEAQACGTLVITYDTGGCSETVDSKSFIVSTGDYCEIACLLKSFY